MNPPQFAEGCFIEHEEYGLGKVISLEGPNVFVIFQHCGGKVITRTLLYRHAVLAAIEPEEGARAWSVPKLNGVSTAPFVSFAHRAYHSYNQGRRIT